MRNTLHKLDSKQADTSQFILDLKYTLRINCVETLVRKILFKIHNLNSQYHHDCEHTKSNKLRALHPSRSAHSSSKKNKVVVTIPSDLHLEPAELSILSKGLKFVPTSSPCEVQLEEDLNKFYRRLRLRAHFYDDLDQARRYEDDVEEENVSGFEKFEKKHKKDWTPNEGEYPILDAFIHATKTEISQLDLQSGNKLNNLTPKERQALSALHKREDIVIKPADKGGAVTVWRKDLYIAEANRQLSDTSFYQHLDHDETDDNNNIVSQTVKQEISKRLLPPEAKALILSRPSCSKFYLIPKIHKIDTPGRPIVSNTNCPTENVSHFLSDILQPLVSSLPSFVKDTTMFIKKVQDFHFAQPSNCVLFTMDVKSLYTVVPNHGGLEALRYFLDQRQTLNPPTDSLLRLAELVLEKNCFVFNNQFYRQIGGICMGTRMGPPYACLFMGLLEKSVLQAYTGKKPSLYLRYIDDIFCAGNMEEHEVNSFISFFGSFSPHIQVSSSIGSSLPFLDTITTIHNQHISTSLYSKTTDSHSYLHYSSQHPKKCKDNIPYSQMLRVKRICSSPTAFQQHATQVQQFFTDRNYPNHITTSSYQKTQNISRDSLLEPHPKSQSNRTPLAINYHPQMIPVVNVVLKNFNMLQTHPSTSHIFVDKPLLAYRRDKNLKDILVKSLVTDPSLPTPTSGTFPCGRPRCKTCAHTSNATTITGPKDTFKVSQHFTCTDTGVVYAIVCTKCGDLYIGETERRLADRFREHLRLAVKQETSKSTVAQHYNLPGHCHLDMEVAGLTHAPNTARRKIIEKKIILRLGTLIPLGLNILGDS